jgi:UDP-N-acetylglucosamine 2-epimerase (non-hydrolysing)
LRVLVVIGTRPEAIKMAPIVSALRQQPECCVSRVCVTGQHRQMLDQALAAFSIVPDYDLNIMTQGQTLHLVASLLMDRLAPVLHDEMPDWVLVQGDTTTAAIGSIAAFYAGLRVAHVEAGLRTGSKREPFPEEVNRRIVSVVSDIHFAPTPKARANLMRENVDPDSVIVTGNTIVDALQEVMRLPSVYAQSRALEGDLATIREVLTRNNPPRVILVTAHRRENLGRALEDICLAVADIASMYGSEVFFVFPVHPNPAVREPVHRLLGGAPNVLLTSPMGYVPLIHLMSQCYLVLTDSGGIQEEAPSLGAPVLVLRDHTERDEGIRAGVAILVGTLRERIVAEVRHLLENPAHHSRMRTSANPYGDGHAAERIVSALLGHAVSEWRTNS